MEKQIKTISGPPWAGVQYFTTQIESGFSQDDWAGLNFGVHCGDNPLHVMQNRQLLTTLLPSTPHWLQQTHSTQLYQALRPVTNTHEYAKTPNADAAWTQASKTVIAVLTADCLPVVIADTQGTIVGVVHAGWRGLANGILEKTLLRLQQQVVKETQWQVWIGPAISQSYFEIGPEVFDIFIKKDKALISYFISATSPNKYLADLSGLAAHILKNIAKDNITIHFSHACTFADKQNYYSYRRQATTGRMATLAWLT